MALDDTVVEYKLPTNELARFDQFFKYRYIGDIVVGLYSACVSSSKLRVRLHCLLLLLFESAFTVLTFVLLLFTHVVQRQLCTTQVLLL